MAVITGSHISFKGDYNREKYITQAELSKLLDLSENCIYKNLRTLKSKGIIERIGSNKKGYWKILNLEEKKR